jgi:D-amino-acid dehydrogenase
MRKKEVIIVGGGIIGLATAYYLNLEGHDVSVIDQDKIKSGASHINSGYLTPSHIIPLAAPGMISKGFRWMFNNSSPFYIKPRFDLDLVNWGMKFIKYCTSEHVQKSMKSILDINLLSKKLFLEMQQSNTFDFHLESKGLLMAYKTSVAEREEAKAASWAKDLGIIVKQLSKEEILKIQPKVPMEVAGAFMYESDAHTTPELFMNNLKNHLMSRGVKFFLDTAVSSFQKKEKKIETLNTNKGIFKADEFVIATGAWTEGILKELGIKLSIQAGKGYSFDVQHITGLSIPAILSEAKVAVTPMSGYTRFGGTMEISGINSKINSRRVLSIVNAAKEYYPGIEIQKTSVDKARSGLRPLSADGLPFIGRHSSFKNLVLASGHAMMGWSLGPATGKLLTELISGYDPSLDLKPYSPERI